MQVIFRFLEFFEPEAKGRSAEPPPEPLRSLLERFAAGDCTPSEREELCGILRSKPDWVRWVAERVKMNRPGSTPDDSGATGYQTGPE